MFDASLSLPNPPRFQEKLVSSEPLGQEAVLPSPDLQRWLIPSSSHAGSLLLGGGAVTVAPFFSLPFVCAQRAAHLKTVSTQIWTALSKFRAGLLLIVLARCSSCLAPLPAWKLLSCKCGEKTKQTQKKDECVFERKAVVLCYLWKVISFEMKGKYGRRVGAGGERAVGIVSLETNDCLSSR